MKKIVMTGLVVASLCSSVASANDFKGSVHLYGGSANIKFKENSTDTTKSSFGFGVSTEKITDDSFTYGLETNFGVVNLDDDVMYNLDVVLKAGYKYKDFRTYALGILSSEKIGSLEGAGFGYGVQGIYDITKNVSMGVEYKTVDLIANALKADYTHSEIRTFISYYY